MKHFYALLKQINISFVPQIKLKLKNILSSGRSTYEASLFNKLFFWFLMCKCVNKVNNLQYKNVFYLT